MERRLAAILAADVVGYSRLIRADEEGTIAAFKALRADLIDPKLAEHNGRIVKLMGDGILVEFASAVDAVRAAVEMQRLIAVRNSSLSEQNRVVFRIGINLGDVVIDGDDIHGDGVNVAARLEGLCEPGGLFISGSVYEQVRDRIDLSFEDLGEQEVKNINRPVRVFHALLNDGAKKPRHAPTTRTASQNSWVTIVVVVVAVAMAGGGVWWWQSRQHDVVPADSAQVALPLPDKPSIAVLPFDNLSGDPQQAYFSDGITEDLITDLSKISGLFVIARNSSFFYRDQQVKVRQIAKELGVRYRAIAFQNLPRSDRR